MPNAGVVDFSTSIDVSADLYVASFATSLGDGGDGGTESIGVEIRIADRIQLQGGEEFSYAIVSIPEDAFPGDENAFAVALKRRGIMDRIKPNSRCTISHVLDGKATAILVGTVIEPTHDIKVDAGSFLIACDKHMLAKYTCWGQLQFDPGTDPKRHMFVGSEPCIFNQFGWPDCLDTTKGPRWAPGPRYGWKPNQTIEPLPGNAIFRARSWRVVDAIAVLRAMHYEVNGWPGTGIMNYGRRFIESNIIWPLGLGSNLVNVNGKDVSTRPLHDFSIENLNLAEALQKLASHAGAFDLYCIPGGHGGDNGNDIMAGLGQEGLGNYLSLQEVFDNQAKALKTAYTNGFNTFAAYLGSAQASLKAAIGDYLKASGGLNYPTSDLDVHFDNVSYAYAQDGTLDNKAAYQSLLSLMGAVLNGDKGRYDPQKDV